LLVSQPKPRIAARAYHVGLQAGSNRLPEETRMKKFRHNLIDLLFGAAA
jgi:hypothetical protein